MSDLPPEWRDEDSGDFEVARLANFPPPPESFFAIPGYFLRVRARQKELKAKITELNGLLSKAEAERDGAEAQLGQAALDFGLLPDMAEEIEQKVAEAERSISSAKGRSSQEAAHHKREIERLDAELNKTREHLEPMAEREKALAEQIAENQANLRRIAAMLNRLQIEQRNVEQALAAGQTNAQVRLVELQAELSKLHGVARQEESQQEGLKREEEALAAEIAPVRKRHQTLEDDRRKQIEEHEAKLGQHSEESRRAYAWRRSRLAVAGRKVFEFQDRPRLTDGDRLFARINSSLEKVAKYQAELELYLRALDSHDHEAVRKARVALITTAVVLALLLIAMLVYSCWTSDRGPSGARGVEAAQPPPEHADLIYAENASDRARLRYDLLTR